MSINSLLSNLISCIPLKTPQDFFPCPLPQTLLAHIRNSAAPSMYNPPIPLESSASYHPRYLEIQPLFLVWLTEER